MYICQARVFASRTDVEGLLFDVRKEPSTLARRRWESTGGGESLHAPGMLGIDALP